MSPAQAQFQALPKEFLSFTDGTHSVNAWMVIARTKTMVDAQSGLIIQTPSHDFIVRARDLVLNGSVVLPAKGNKVIRVFCGKTYTYQLMTPPFDPHDHAGEFLRLHSKLISTV